MNQMNQVTVLLVEDDPAHATLVKRNLLRGGVTNRLIHIDNGRKAVDFIFSKGDYEGEILPSPLLILLDLNMPEMDGYEVLKTIKNDPASKNIPVVILTTTDNPTEISRCYELGCNVYISKPVEYDKFCEAIRSLGFFIGIVALPGEDTI